MNVREVLDQLRRSTLVRLTQERNLGGALTNGQRSSMLAQWFDGDLRALLESLDESELADVASVEWARDGQLYRMNSPAWRSKDRLVDLLANFAEGGRISHDFYKSSGDEGEGDFGEDEVGEDEADEDEADEDEADDDGADDDGADADRADEDEAGEDEVGEENEDPADAAEVPDATASFLASFGAEWSRPLLLSRLLWRLQGVYVQRLKASRFQELVQQLQEAGLEVQLQDGTPVTVESESPGVQTKVRLRKAGLSRLQPVVVPSPDRTAPPGRRTLSPYSLALNRLKLLTALPDSERRHNPLWPTSFLEEAMQGLELPEVDRKLLAVVAAGFAVGSHAPAHAASELRDAISDAEWDQLLDSLQSLNQHLGEIPVQVAQIIRDSLSLPQSGPKQTVLVETDPRVPASQVTSPVRPAPNQRDLGALNDLFADLAKN